MNINSNILILLRGELKPSETGREQGDNKRKCVSHTKEQTAGDSTSEREVNIRKVCREDVLIPLNHTGGSRSCLNSLATSARAQSGAWGMRTKGKFTLWIPLVRAGEIALRPALEDANGRKENPVKEEQKCQVIGSLSSIKEIKAPLTRHSAMIPPRTAVRVTSNQCSVDSGLQRAPQLLGGFAFTWQT